jgi:hypothetical protein
MPRKRWKTKDRREPLEDSMKAYLLTGSHTAAMAAHAAAGFPDGMGFAGLGQYYLDWPRHPQFWAANADELIEETIRATPGRRPWGWWRWTATDGRRRLGGAGCPVPYGRHGAESWREHFGLPVLRDLDPDDPPVFESEAAALRRFDVLTRQEARRLRPQAFEPVEMLVPTGRARAYNALGYAPPDEVIEEGQGDDHETHDPNDHEENACGSPDRSFVKVRRVRCQPNRRRLAR